MVGVTWFNQVSKYQRPFTTQAHVHTQCLNPLGLTGSLCGNLEISVCLDSLVSILTEIIIIRNIPPYLSLLPE